MVETETIVGQSTGLVKITDSLTQLLNYGQYSTFK